MALHLSKAFVLGLAGAVTLALGGCYDDGYGYGGVEAGAGYYGGGYGYDGYDPDYAGGYGYGYGGYGWFDGFYYPGTGFYVYDRGGHRRHMRNNDWQHWHGGGPGGQSQAGNWQGRGSRGSGQSGNWHGRGSQGGESTAPPPGAPQPGQRRWQGRGQGQDGRARYRGDGNAARWQQRGGEQGVAPQGLRSATPMRSDGGGGRNPGRRRGGD